MKLGEIKSALKMLNCNMSENTLVPNTNLTLKEFLLKLGIREESYYENLMKNKKEPS